MVVLFRSGSVFVVVIVVIVIVIDVIVVIVIVVMVAVLAHGRFTMVTVGTIGYGDVTPKSKPVFFMTEASDCNNNNNSLITIKITNILS